VNDTAFESSTGTTLVRLFAWANVAAVTVFLINNYLSYWQGWPGAGALFGGSDGGLLALLQAALYAAAIIFAVAFVARSGARSLRADSATLNGVVNYLIRACFWAVLFVGLADMLVSFLRVEALLPSVFGAELAGKLDLPRWRGPYVHGPAILLGILVAMFTRTLGFTWLTLLVVIAELQIVLSRFVFSYEQAFMGDLVRFWYAALFLFASAYTLHEEGHVRVDVLYASLSRRTKGKVNAFGCVLLGILFCWVVLYLGLSSKSAAINAPLISLEISQSGFGMYTKYLMAGFLGVFAVTMLIQFCAYLLENVADWRGDPGGREVVEDDDPFAAASGH
ncbi:MAG: TRAP transporter small permease subunit, partial [Pseudomonadota bacterium]